jgi:protoheme IX farnesyltransferase
MAAVAVLLLLVAALFAVGRGPNQLFVLDLPSHTVSAEASFGAAVVLLFGLCLWYLTYRPHARQRVSTAAGPQWLVTAQSYVALAKPRIIPLLLVPTAAAMLIANRLQPVPTEELIRLFVLTLAGGTLASGGAHVFNSYLDRDLDATMRRTRARPFPRGRVGTAPALAFGTALSAAAVLLLGFTVNWLAALLALAGNLFYVLVYSLWLKRATPQNIVIGGAAGAVPPLVGWAALTNQVGLPAVLLFAIIFFWTPAHFWALALVREEDYKAAGIPMLPVIAGAEFTRQRIVLYAVLLTVAALLLYVTRSMGVLYLVAAVGLSALFLVKALQLLNGRSLQRAWNLFMYSNVYLLLLYGAMVLDRLLAR